MKCNDPNPVGCSKSNSKREVYPLSLPLVYPSLQAYPRKQEKPQINNLTLYLKQLEKEGQTKPKVCRREEIIEIRAEILNKWNGDKT